MKGYYCLLKLAGLLLLLNFISACSSTINFTVNAAAKLNPDMDDRALAVEMRIYELRDNNAFNNATFQQLWKHDKAILGHSLIERRSLLVRPGDQIKVTLSRNAQAHYVAAIAIFRDPTSGKWRVITRVPGAFSSVTLALLNNQIFVN